MKRPKKDKRPDGVGRERRRALPERDRDDIASAPPVVGLVSLGCVKNLVDSERMLAQIAESGAVITADESAADTMVVNTCGFLGAARDEALEVITELAARKRRGLLRRLVVVGCLVQRDGRKLLDDVPEIDALVGVHNRDDVARAVWGPAPHKLQPAALQEGADLYLGEYHPQPWSDQVRLRLTPQHYAYVRISEGCNQKCTFCTIPSIRGPMHSKTPEQLIAESRELINDGARELILIGQDTTSYGVDIGHEPGLAGLLRTLDAECDGARWIRLMYVYPSILNDDTIDAIASCDRIVKYVDIPLQHISDRVLKFMGRRVTRRQTELLLEKIRRRIPGVTIRTTFIVGFPGESAAEFEELLEFVGSFGFDAVGAFEYSLEPETPAARVPGPIDDRLKSERYERLMLTQQAVALAAAHRRIGTSFEVLVDGPGAEGRGVTRHAGQAPEIDAACLLDDEKCPVGEFVEVRCVDSAGYDLVVQPLRQRLPMV